PRVLVRTEVWFDAAKKLRHTVTTKDGRVVEDVLETPEEVLSEEGPVWTCARIARHPVEATRDRVSCNFNGDNGTTPRDVPETPPVLEPALATFLSGYRQALESGHAHIVGEGTID